MDRCLRPLPLGGEPDDPGLMTVRLRAENSDCEIVRRVFDVLDAERKRAKEQAETAQKDIERAGRAKNEFLSRMSHDLRTPLNAVLGFAELLAMDPLTPDQRESVMQILQAGRHLLGLTNEVLDLSRIEAGHLPLSPEPVCVADVIEETVGLARALAVPRRIDIDTARGAGVDRHVRADRQRLSQVLANFLSNAIKYNREGGRVTVSCDQTAGRRVRIVVADTGPGIKPELLHRLFKPFERLGAEQTAIEGTGLGLALSRGLAEAMGESVGVESVAGKGATFWIELASAVAADQAVRESPVRGRTDVIVPVSGVVLYIEDNAANIRLVERLLCQRRPGVTLLSAGNGDLGIAMALRYKPDLIFLDLHLPDTPGDEVLRRLWADPKTRQIPVAVLSADATSGQSRRLLESGASAYLTKPIEMGRLLTLIDERLLA